MPKRLLIVVIAVAFCAFSNKKFNTVAPDAPTSRAAAITLPVVKKVHNARILTRVNFEDSVQNLYHRIGLASYGLDYKVFRLGLIGYYSLDREDALSRKGLVTIIDFSRPSTEKRFYTIDLKKQQVRYHTYVAHGRNTGENMATAFSNTPHSNQSSLGFYVTGETYVGSKGYSLRLDGKEDSFNDKIRSRAVVIHAADYATEAFIRRYGRLGRSQGCPALPPALSKEIIDTIKGKTAIFTYYPDEHYLKASRYLKVEDLFQKLDKMDDLTATSAQRQS